MSSRILTAVAWPYANGPRHIGHVSGFGVPPTSSRFMRMSGPRRDDGLGTDEHGTPISVQAEREGLTTASWPTSKPGHRRRPAGYWACPTTCSPTVTQPLPGPCRMSSRACNDNGYVVPQVTKGAVSPTPGRTLPDRYIEGTCPICGFDGAAATSATTAGNQLDPVDLINPRSRITARPRSSSRTRALLPGPAGTRGLPGRGWLSARTDWRPNVLKFSQNLLDDLKPRASRAISTGVCRSRWTDVGPADEGLYVWFDAVIGYLSASVEWARRTGDRRPGGSGGRTPEALSYYFMGKDNFVFHSVIWPGLLLGHNGQGDHGGQVGPLGELRLPDEVVSSEFLTMSGSKFSTSRGQVIYVGDFLSEFGPTRCATSSRVAGTENQDSDFTWDEFVRRNNFELANEWATWSTLGLDGAQERRRHPRGARFCATSTSPDAASRGAFDSIGDLLRRSRFKQPSARR